MLESLPVIHRCLILRMCVEMKLEDEDVDEETAQRLDQLNEEEEQLHFTVRPLTRPSLWQFSKIFRSSIVLTFLFLFPLRRLPSALASLSGRAMWYVTTRCSHATMLQCCHAVCCTGVHADVPETAA